MTTKFIGNGCDSRTSLRLILYEIYKRCDQFEPLLLLLYFIIQSYIVTKSGNLSINFPTI